MCRILFYIYAYTHGYWTYSGATPLFRSEPTRIIHLYAVSPARTRVRAGVVPNHENESCYRPQRHRTDDRKGTPLRDEKRETETDRRRGTNESAPVTREEGAGIRACARQHGTHSKTSDLAAIDGSVDTDGEAL